MKDDLYFFHQSPVSLCKDIISNIDFDQDHDIILEPFAGECNFYNNFPEGITKYKCEIEDGLCYKDFDYDGIKPTTIVTNPPFRINGKNVFFDIMLFYSQIKSIKNMYILSSAVCFESLTPIRMFKLNEKGLFINKITTINVKKWRGRYYLIRFNRTYNSSFDYYSGNYE